MDEEVACRGPAVSTARTASSLATAGRVVARHWPLPPPRRVAGGGGGGGGEAGAAVTVEDVCPSGVRAAPRVT